MLKTEPPDYNGSTKLGTGTGTTDGIGWKHSKSFLVTVAASGRPVLILKSAQEFVRHVPLVVHTRTRIRMQVIDDDT